MNEIGIGPEPHVRKRPCVPRAPRPVVVREDASEIVFEADVLIIGGGLAGAWAAIAAAEAGARVLVAEKGYCGTSGVAAAVCTSHWLVPPDDDLRTSAIARRERIGGFLTDRDWINATLDVAWERTARLPEWGLDTSKYPNLIGYLIGKDTLEHRSFMGASVTYLRFLRGRVIKVGAKILDHSPAVELLRDADGVVSGARGFQRQRGRAWRVSAGAVILATGGTAWMSRSLGSDVNTGEGHVMAAEVGAHLSGMECSNWYSTAFAGTSLTSNAYFVHASYYDADKVPLDFGDLRYDRMALWQAAARTQLHAQMAQFTTDEERRLARQAMPYVFMAADKLGIDPLREPVPLEFLQDGTVRTTGGVYVQDMHASTGVAGLYAAGDIAARDRIAGFSMSAGGPNASWAIASGTWSGRAAASFSRGHAPDEPDRLERTGTVGLRPQGRPGPAEQWRRVLADTQSEMLPIDKMLQRTTDTGLRTSLRALDRAWDEAVHSLAGEGGDEIRLREVVGMLAMARWSCRAALERTETRGIFNRTDHRATDPAQARRQLIGGLDTIWVRPDPDQPKTIAKPTTETSPAPATPVSMDCTSRTTCR